MKRVMVTGGAGFIGSHVVDRLLAGGDEVIVYDNFSTGSMWNLRQHAGSDRLFVAQGNVLDLPPLRENMEGCQAVFHFQANADVRGGVADTRRDLEQNTIATWNALEAARLAGVGTFVFASSAVVYGEPGVFPTPETATLRQTSLYGASKLACEAMAEAYSEYFGIRVLIFRFVSWVGPRYSHGVVADFVAKLRRDPHMLEILGDGAQEKSYLHVADGVDGIFLAYGADTGRKAVFNLGHDAHVNVVEVASAVAEEMGLQGVMFKMAGGRRGWPGDSPLVHLDTTRMRMLGWSPRIPILEGIRDTARFLLRGRM